MRYRISLTAERKWLTNGVIQVSSYRVSGKQALEARFIWYLQFLARCALLMQREASRMRNASSAKDQNHLQYFTMREYPKPLATASMARYIYKEIKMLRFLRHENVRPLGTTPFIMFVLTE